MLYPSVFHRVRMIGREDQFIIARVDHTASVVDLCALAGQTDLETAVPFCMLCPPELEDASFASNAQQDGVDAVGEILRSSSLHLSQSHAVLADTADLISATMRMIKMTQAMIADSDRLISRSMRADGRKD